MREGKSFLLSLLIKYLNSGQIENWLSRDSELHGFSWKGGVERDTLGILMWSLPFHVEDEKGQKVAVLLMDTQGAFDNEHTMAQSTKIMTMSLLPSSIQIYNVTKSLRADKLEFFRLFLEHAKLVQQQTKEKVFQSLMFLVRDWSNQEDHDFGLDGGTAHVREQMKCFSSSGAIGKKDFKQLFQSMEGFLLPYPGDKVAEQRQGSESFKGEASDMDEDFLKYIKILARYLFRPKSIIKKAIAGAEMNGRSLVGYAEDISKILDYKDMPEPKDLFEAQIQAHSSNMLDEFTQKFNMRLCEFLSVDHFLDDETLENQGEIAFAAIMEEFEKRQVYGGPEIKNHCRMTLKASLKHALQQVRIRNRDTRNKYRKKYEEFFSTEVESMEKKLGKVFDKHCVLEKDIERKCRNSAKEIERKLLEHNFGVEIFDEEFLDKIADWSKRLCDSLIAKNELEQDAANSKSTAKRAELAHLAKTMLTEELAENIYSTELEVVEVVHRVKTQIIKKWEDELADYPDFIPQKYKTSLDEKFGDLQRFAEKHNAENKERFSRNTSWELSEVCETYNGEMAKVAVIFRDVT